MSGRRVAAQRAIAALFENETSDDEASDSASETEDNVLDELYSEVDSTDEHRVDEVDHTPNTSAGLPSHVSDFQCRNSDISWSSTPPSSSQTRSHNIFRDIFGPTASVRRSAGTKRLMLEQFITLEMQNLIIVHTNDYARSLIQQQGEDSWLAKRWEPLDNTELMAFIGVLLLIGIYRSSHENYEQLWSERHGCSRLRATMSLYRFKLLLRMIRFDDKRTR